MNTTTIKKYHPARLARVLTLACLAMLTLTFGAFPARAQGVSQYFAYTATTNTWDTTSLFWGTASGGPYSVAWTNLNNAVFQGTTGGVVTVSSGISVTNLTVNTGGYTLQGAPITVYGNIVGPSSGVVISSTVNAIRLSSSIGTVTLTGTNNYFTNGFDIFSGTLTLGGSTTSAGGCDMRGGSTLNLTNNLTISGNLLIGCLGSVVTLNQTAGNLSGSVFVGANYFYVGSGVYNLYGGTMNGSLVVGNAYGTTNTFNMTNGTVTVASLYLDNVGSNDIANYYQSGGSVTATNLYLGSSASVTNTIQNLFITNGTFTAKTWGANSFGAGSTNQIQLYFGPGANVTLPAWPTAHGAGSTEQVTFDGGTLSPSAASVNYLTNLTAAYLTTNGLNFNVTNDITVGQVLADAPGQSGTLTKSGTNTLTLAGANTYTGQTTVSAGTLGLGNASLVGALVMSNDTALNLAGSNSVASLTFAGAGSLNYDLSNGGTLTVTGNNGVTNSGALGSLVINVVGALPPGGTYTLISYTGSLKGSGFTYVLGSVPAGYTLVNGLGKVQLIVPPASYLIYDGNGSDGGTVPAAVTNNYGSTISVASATMTLSNYTFYAWNTAANGSGTQYLPGDTFTFTNNNTTLYAQWSAIHYWDNNGATLGFGTAGGIWSGFTTNWNTNTLGSTAPGGYLTTTNDEVIFNGLASGTITVSNVNVAELEFGGTFFFTNGVNVPGIATNGLLVTNGSVTLAGGTIYGLNHIYNSGSNTITSALNTGYNTNGNTLAILQYGLGLTATMVIAGPVSSNYTTITMANHVTPGTMPTVKIDAGAGGTFAGAPSINDGQGYHLVYDNTTSTNDQTQAFGLLGQNRGEHLITSVRTAAHNVTLSFTNINNLTRGCGVNFETIGGVNGVNNSILMGGVPTNAVLGNNAFFGGNIAFVDAAGYIRGLAATDPSAIVAPAGATIGTVASTNDVLLTGTITNQTTASIASLIMGSNSLAIGANQTLTLTRIAVSGNTNAVIDGTNGTISGTSWIRVDQASDVLTINATNKTGSYKLGQGTLVCNGPINGGLYCLNGTILVNAICTGGVGLVAPGATIGGNGTLASLSLGVIGGQGGGIIQPSLSGNVATLTVSGTISLTQGILKLRAPTNNAVDQFSLTASTNVFDASQFDTIVDATGLAGTSFGQVIVQTANAAGITNKFDSFYVNRTNVTSTVHYNASNITLDLAAPATLSFNGNSNTSGTVSASVTNTYPATYTIPGQGTLARSGYVFYGWNTAADGSGTAYAAGSTFNFQANTTLYAQWAPTTVLSYNGNGNDGGTAPAPVTNIYPNTVVVTNAGTLTLTGFYLSSWNTATNGAGTTYLVGSTYAFTTTNTTLYAQWLSTNTGCIIKVSSTNAGTGNFTAAVIPNSQYVVQVNTNLSGTNWVNISTNTSTAAGVLNFTDSKTVQQRGGDVFYRLKH